jgi:hypothetical protein
MSILKVTTAYLGLDGLNQQDFIITAILITIEGLILFASNTSRRNYKDECRYNELAGPHRKRC